MTVGKGPKGVAVDPSTHMVYVANSGDNAVSVIDAASRTVVGSIRVSGEPSAVAVDPGTHTVFIQHRGFRQSGGPYPLDCYVSVIDSSTWTVIATVPVGAAIVGALAVDSAAHLVYVSNDDDNTLSVIDGKTYAVIDTVPVGAELTGVAVDPGTSSIYVTTETGGTGGNVRPVGKDAVQVIDGVSRAVIATFPAGGGPRAVAVDPITHDVYVANFWGRDISVIDGSTRSVVATVPVDDGMRGNLGFGVDPSTHTVYGTVYTHPTPHHIAGAVVVIDGPTQVVTATVPTGSDALGLAVDPGTHTVYVTNPEDGAVSIIESVMG